MSELQNKANLVKLSSIFFQIFYSTAILVTSVPKNILSIFGFLIISILASNIFFNNDLSLKDIFPEFLKNISEQEKFKTQFNILVCLIALPFIFISTYSYHPLTNNFLGESLLWAFATVSVSTSCQALKNYSFNLKSKSLASLIKLLTTPIISKKLPLGTLLNYIVYSPYMIVYLILTESIRIPKTLFIINPSIQLALLVILLSTIYKKISLKFTMF